MEGSGSGCSCGWAFGVASNRSVSSSAVMPGIGGTTGSRDMGAPFWYGLLADNLPYTMLVHREQPLWRCTMAEVTFQEFETIEEAREQSAASFCPRSVAISRIRKQKEVLVLKYHLSDPVSDSHQASPFVSHEWNRLELIDFAKAILRHLQPTTEQEILAALQRMEKEK